MPLEIKYNPFEHTHENITFREVANRLHQWFDQKRWDGLLMGNPTPVDNPLFQPDLLLFTPKSILIIDLKNYGGELRLPPRDSFGSNVWLCDGIRVKGGSFINPFVQLGRHRRWLGEILEAVPETERAFHQGMETRHITTMVYFHKSVKVMGRIPGEYEKGFFIGDSENILNLIEDITSQAINLTQAHFERINSLFAATDYNLQEEVMDSQEQEDVGVLSRELWPEQVKASTAFKHFLTSNDRILVLAGPEHCGKTFLIPHLRELAFQSGVQQMEILAPTGRIANVLKMHTGLAFKSLYSTIYGGAQLERDKKTETVGAEEEEKQSPDTVNELEEELPKEIVPLRSDLEFAEDAVFLVDEAHLVTNSYHDTEFTRFGSGYVLEDFLHFLHLKDNSRKVVFLGDPYQLSYGKTEESAVRSDFIRDLAGVGVRYYKIEPNSKVGAEDSRLRQNQAIAASIDQGIFNHLVFHDADEIKLTPRQEAYSILQRWIQGRDPFIFLTYTNRNAHEINLYIRKNYLGRKHDLEKNDLLMINNTIHVPGDDPLQKPRMLINGTFLTVHSTGEEKQVSINRKGGAEPVTLRFRKVEVYIPNETDPVEIWSLENYRKSENAELDREDAIALRIFQYRHINKLQKDNPFEASPECKNWQSSSEYKRLRMEIDNLEKKLKEGEKAKTKLEETERQFRKLETKWKRTYRRRWKLHALHHDPFLNAAYLRFGWSINVHKALGARWDRVLFNTDMGENHGRTNQSYFQWLYTGLARSSGIIHLVNFKPIHPLMDLHIVKMPELITVKEKRPSAVVKFDDEKPLLEEEVKVAEGLGFDLAKVAQIRCACALYAALQEKGLAIKSVSYQNYQDVYVANGTEGREVRFAVFYDKKLHFKSPTIQTASTPQLRQEIGRYLLENVLPSLLWQQITPAWKSSVYQQMKDQLKEQGWDLSVLAQNNYQDLLMVSSGEHWITFTMTYDGDGFFTKLTPKEGNTRDPWPTIISSFQPNAYDQT